LKRVPFRLEPGLEIVVRGSLNLYAPQGKFQIKAFAIEPVGRGALQLAFEQLKAKLSAEGLFARERKRAIPKLPRSIAVITSPSGAVVRDILHVLSRRFEGLAITIYPVRVQGELAAAEIVAAIRHLNRRAGFDVLILARGGGSPEDLAPFNAEIVARALAASAIPTISGVGHETDWTICDLVADLRAPTPSAAAELVVERKDEIVRRVDQCRGTLLRAMRGRLALSRARVDGHSRGEALAGFPRRLAALRGRVAQGRQALTVLLERRPAEYASRLTAALRALRDFPRVVELARRRDAVAALAAMLHERFERAAERRRRQVASLSARLQGLSPLAVLARGYAVAWREGAKRPLLSAAEVEDGARIRVRLAEGELSALVRGGGRIFDPGPLFRGEGEKE
jgi:exodeoxyribonuclease VII large subunit